MALIRLQYPLHDRTLVQQVCEARHVQGIEKVYLEEVLVADSVAKERDAFDEGDVADEDGFAIIGIAPITDGEGMVNTRAQISNVSIDYTRSVVDPLALCPPYSPSSAARLPLYSI